MVFIKMKKLVVTMCLNNWEPEITKLTFPLMKHYAKKIGADFWDIDQRKYPNCPIGYERFQIYDVHDNYDWVLQIDADACIHPDMPDMTALVNKDTIFISKPDHSAKRFISDKYFYRDGRFTSVPGFFTVTSDWCKDFWQLPNDLTPEEAISKVPVTASASTVKREPSGVPPSESIFRSINFCSKFASGIKV